MNAIIQRDAAEWFPIASVPRTTPTHQVMLFRPGADLLNELEIAGYQARDERGEAHWLSCNGQPIGYWSPSRGEWMGGPTHWRLRAERPE